VDAINPLKFIGPACVIDVTRDVDANPDFLLTVDRVEQWESSHGRIPRGAWLLLRTGWSNRTDPARYINLGDDSGIKVGQVLFVKRISADAFFDHAQAIDYGSPVNRLYRSTGIEMIFDLNVFHWPGFRVGLREAYRIDYRNQRLQPFLAFGW